MNFRSEQRTGMLLVIVSALSFSTLTPLIKQIYIVDPALNPQNVITWRFIFAVPLIWALAFMYRAQQPARDALPRWRLFGVGMLFAPNPLLAFNALAIIPVSTYSLIFYSYPAIIVLISTMFLGERLSRWGWIALALTLVGLGLTVPDVIDGLEGGDPLGVLLTLGNIATYAFYFIVYGRTLRGQSAMLEASAITMTGTLFVLFGVAVAQGFVFPANWTSWLILAAMGLVGTVIPLTTLFAGVKKIGNSRAAIFSTVEPISTLMLAFFLLGERLQPLQLVGGVLVLISVVILQTSSAPSTPKHDTLKELQYDFKKERV